MVTINRTPLSHCRDPWLLIAQHVHNLASTCQRLGKVIEIGLSYNVVHNQLQRTPSGLYTKSSSWQMEISKPIMYGNSLMEMYGSSIEVELHRIEKNISHSWHQLLNDLQCVFPCINANASANADT